jgi:hypothetical protein
LYQVQGLADEELQGFAEDEELRGLEEDEMTQVMGIGYPGEVRQGPDGNPYQWVQGVDGLGNPVGWWRSLRRRLRRLARRVAPWAERLAPFIPGGAAVAAGLRIARQAGVAGYPGLGALYQAPDGSLYQVQGLADEELQGFAEDEELRGLEEDEELRGLAEEQELGYFSDEELTGYGADEELNGYGEDEALGDLNGYVRDERVSGFEAFVPDQPAGTRMFSQPAQAPDMWKSLW